MAGARMAMYMPSLLGGRPETVYTDIVIATDRRIAEQVINHVNQ